MQYTKTHRLQNMCEAHEICLLKEVSFVRKFSEREDLRAEDLFLKHG